MPADRNASRTRLMTKALFLFVTFVSCLLVGLGIFSMWPPGSTSTMRLLSVVTTPTARHFVSATDYATVWGSNLYVAYGGADALLVIDTRTNNIRTFAAGMTGVHGVAFSTEGTLGFATLGGRNGIAVLKTGDGSTLKIVPAGADPDGVVFDRHADLAYAGNSKSESATLVPAHDLDHAYSLALGGSPEFPQVDEATGMIYQPLEDTNEVVIIDPAVKRVVKRFSIAPCSGPHGAAIDLEHRVLFLGCSNRMLAVMDLANGGIVATVPAGRFIDVVAFDPVLHRIYTANSAGSMTVVQQTLEGSYRVLETVRTAAGGHTLAVDPRTHRVYIVCSGLRSARILVYAPTLVR